MFKKMFGGNKKPEKKEEPQTPASSPSNPINSSDLDFEVVLTNVRRQEIVFENMIEKYSQRIDDVRVKAKECLRTGQQKKAKSCLTEVKLLEQHIENAENQKMVFLKIRIQLENGKTNKSSANVLKQAVESLKTIDTAVIEDAMDDLQEIDATQKEISGLFKQMADSGTNDEELDEEMAKLQKELDEEKSLKLEQEFNKLPNAQLNQNVNQQKQPIGHMQRPQAEQQKQKPFDNALFDQLMD